MNELNMNESQTQLQFLGTRGQLAKLHVKSILLMIVTLGIYRFWYKTNIRRYLWNKITFNQDERFEYTGTGVELLKGFALALLFIVPLNLSVSLASFTSFHFTIIAVAMLVATFLGYFALYAARRYILTRTLWRGLRFRLDGSGLKFALRAFAWFFAIILTLGLINPWAMAWFERTIMGNTRFGTAQASFTGKGFPLFLKLLPFTGFTFVPFIAGITVFLRMVDMGDMADIFAALQTGEDDIIKEAYAESSEGTRSAIMSLYWVLPLWLFALMLFAPAKKAITFRWFASNITLGEASFSSTFSIWQAYKIYIKASLVFVAGFILFSLFGYLIKDFIMLQGLTLFAGNQFIFAGLAIVAYLALIILFVLYKALMVTLPFWRAQINSITAFNLESLDDVVAHGQESSAFGESLADGAADIGF
jgi:uncharacterized membrane protein YjgN (DUF898 family)